MCSSVALDDNFKKKKELGFFVSCLTLNYGPAELGVRVGPVIFWYVDVCIMISLVLYFEVQQMQVGVYALLVY
jgi:hypothetical protein